MNILALDTSFGACSAAVLRRDGQMFFVYEEMARGHAEALMPMVERAMREAALDFSAIGTVATTTGPGSFTGVRIGIAAAHGFAIACDARMAGSDSLHVMARRAASENLWREDDGPLAVCVDARRGEIYYAIFEANGVRTPPVVASIADAARALPHAATAAGTGAALVAGEAGRTDLKLVAPELQPHAAALADLVASGEAARGPLRPLYLRAPDAKPQTAPSLRAS